MSATLVASYSAAQTSDTVTVANVTAADGDTIVLACFIDSGAGVADDGAWGSAVISAAGDQFGTASGGLGSQLSVFVLYEVSAGTHDVTLPLGFSSTWAAVVEVWRGMKQTPLDKGHSGSGTSTTPSSGATATTTQAEETVLGFIGTDGPSSDSAGTWQDSYLDGTRVGSGNRTISTGHFFATGTGAFTAHKTGITSRSWAAGVLTFKLAADQTITLPLATAAGAAPSPTVTPGAAAITLDLATAQAAAPDLTVTDPRVYMGTEANGVVDPPASVPSGASSIAQSRGVRSFGEPYFAMWMQTPGAFTQFGGGENTLLLSVALNAMPVQVSSADEPHYLASIHEVGGMEVFSIGVTPNGRVVASTAFGPMLQSAPGIVQADGVARNIQLFFAGGTTRQLSVDDLIVAYDDIGGGFGVNGPYSPTNIPVIVMLFNGVEAKTICDCTIYWCGLQGENTPVVWPMAPIVGVTVPGIETDGAWIGDPPTPHEAPDYEGADFTLTAGFFDPRPFHPLAAGDFPTDPVQTAFGRKLNTQYRQRVPVTPNYRLVGSA